MFGAKLFLLRDIKARGAPASAWRAAPFNRCSDMLLLLLLQDKIRARYGTWDRFVQVHENMKAAIDAAMAGGGRCQRPPWLPAVGLHVAARAPCPICPC